MIKSKITYAEKLDYYVKNYNLIPYRLHPKARYRTNCYYWIAMEEKWFKVEEVEYCFNNRTNPILDHVQIMWMDHLQGYICTDLCIYDFRLEKDKFNIRGLKTLVNTNESYSGAEIEYWLFVHDISIMDDKYTEFWKYIDRDSESHIDSNRFYYIYAKEDSKGNYYNVYFKLDPTRHKFGLDRNQISKGGNKK